jgi:4-hydroxybenzoate polyprenyltransferase
MDSPKKTISSTIKPFIELMRVSNPVGSLLVYFPHLIGSLFAACCVPSNDGVTTARLMVTSMVLLPASALLHGAGCSWNDIVDADLDRLVARTKNRPIPRGAISMRQAYLFTAAETLTWLCILWMLTERLLLWSLPMVFLVGVYPYAKRFTNYPSVVLGFVLAYGLFLGCVSMDIDPIEIFLHGSPSTLAATVCLFMTYTLVVTSVDMVYAYQDLADDLKAGIRSMAVTFRGYPKLALSASAAAQLILLTYSGQLMEFSDVYTAIACAGFAGANAWMIWSVDLKSSMQCWWWFQYGSMMMGSILSLAMLAEYTGGLGGTNHVGRGQNGTEAMGKYWTSLQ